MPQNPAFLLAPRQTPTSVATALPKQAADQAPLTDTDFEHLFNKAVESKASGEQVHKFINSNDVSENERAAFYDWVNKGPGQARRDEIAADPAKAELEGRPDTNVFSVGGVGVGPEALLGVGALGKTAISAGKAAISGNLPAVAEQAVPFAKFEVARWLLAKAGVPSD